MKFDNTLHREYIYDTCVSLQKDYLSHLIISTPVFTQYTTPRVPFLSNQGRDHFMHYTMRNLLVFLHKLDIRP